MKRKWIPDGDIKVIEKEKYRYEFGWYNHDKYGRCFRMSKYLKHNLYFIGHFVIVENDKDIFKEVIKSFQK